MDQNNTTPNWADDIVPTQDTPTEIGPDEQAIYGAGLTHPNDLELEKILAEDWDNAPTPQEPEQPVRKEKEVNTMEQTNVRPKKNKKSLGVMSLPYLLSTIIWALLIIVVGFSMGRTLWVSCAEVMAFGKPDHQVTINISYEDSVNDVARKLGNANLIRYPGLFKLFAKATGKAENISSGTYTLNAKLDYNALINAMTSYDTREVVEIMFPEGATCAQIFKALEDKNVCTVADLEEYAANGELKDYWFLVGVERGSKYCLEGYLAPDTYKFYTQDNPRRVLEKLLDEFDDRFTDIMKEDLEDMQYRYAVMLSKEGYSSEYIETHKLTLHQVLTVASVIQKETGSSSESFDIASVFYNRLASGEPLGSDATVHYAIGDYFTEKAELSASDLNSSSPYNTRKNRGLPPGPICNPGTYAFYAALDPNDTNYMYFVYDSAAKEHLFSTTYDEHLKKVQQLGL